MSITPYTSGQEFATNIPESTSDLVNDSGFITSTHGHPSEDITGLADVAMSGVYNDLSGKPSLATVATSGSYTDLSNKPALKRIETYSGTTNASGNYTITYSTPFASVPNVLAFLSAGTHSQTVILTSSTVNGFTFNVANRGAVTLLAVEVLLASTTPVNAAGIRVIVIES